jgi:hypothetical protein
VTAVSRVSPITAKAMIRWRFFQAESRIVAIPLAIGSR